MSGIDRIGRAGGVGRETPSAGHEAIDKAQRREVSSSPRNAKVDEVATLYEKQFLREMVKAMRSTVSFSDVTKPSMAENIYRDQLDSEYVEAWGDKGGIGLSELIYDQLMQRYFGDNSGALKAQGPIALSDRDVLRVSEVKSGVPAEAPKQVPLRVELKPDANKLGSTQLKAPWDAEVISQSKLDGKTILSLQHTGNLKSTLIFEGVPNSDVSPGARLNKGQTVGVLSPEINSFFWNISQSVGQSSQQISQTPVGSR